jgi:hypothetical protein
MGILAKKLVRTVFSSYRNRAIKRNFKFELTLPQFTVLLQGNCIYCNKKAEENKRSGKVNYSGIDRINNEKGYIKDNVASCCSMCNYMKASYTLKEFLEQVKRISQKNVLCLN